MPNERMKKVIQQFHNLYIDLTMEERKDYSQAQQAALESPNDIMTLIINDMDQNTTIVLRFKQMVKDIESRFVKTHLCGVLVHGIGLY